MFECFYLHMGTTVGGDESQAYLQEVLKERRRKTGLSMFSISDRSINVLLKPQILFFGKEHSIKMRLLNDSVHSRKHIPMHYNSKMAPLFLHGTTTTAL